MSYWKLFLISVALTASVLLAVIYLNRSPRKIPPTYKLIQISEGVFITAQLKPSDLLTLSGREGIRTLVDIRPDGEVKDQPSSTEIAIASKNVGLDFHYIPVPHESIPVQAVDSLKEVLLKQEKPIVLYCRTGRRAVRLFALVEASRADGPNKDEIMKLVKDAGFNADDLTDKIVERISQRNSVKQEGKHVQ